MSYGGDSNAKKLARVRFWSDLLADMEYGRSVCSRSGCRFLVLAGPDAADVKTLKALSVPGCQITAVDTDADALRSSKRIEPNAKYLFGDVNKVVQRKKHRHLYKVAFLDFCNPLSEQLVHRCVQTAAFALKENGYLGLGFMYGRETGKTRDEIVKLKEDLYASGGRSKAVHITNSSELNKGEKESVFSQAARINYLYDTFLTRSLPFGFGLWPTRVYFYRSGKRVKGKKHSVGVPMFYALFKCMKPVGAVSNKKLQKKMIKEWLAQGKPFSVVYFPDDADAEQIKKMAVDGAKKLGSKHVSELLNLPTQRVAAWLAWDTMRREGTDPHKTLKLNREEGGCLE